MQMKCSAHARLDEEKWARTEREGCLVSSRAGDSEFGRALAERSSTESRRLSPFFFFHNTRTQHNTQ